ncbi:aldo/keto reductase [Propionibacterium australiense]|uniref:Aldo/keto reductase n=1 Tax=Propionibacterium australiense TaxID=119981 RepID=A0A8B3FT67_9ACTN|nr:aldo/keto reductase [Propionibacterium australiense]RLP10729.1 aldo/keto reductase [Propionibacterium australiense]
MAPASSFENQTYLTLNDGNRIPQFGMGVYLVPDGEPTETAVTEALRLGYRHIDTAHAYQNERSVGRAVRASGVDRGEVWITTKLWPSEYGEGATAAAIDKMLDRLGTGYIDLLLLHQQFGDYKGAWRDMERAVAAGTVRSIGISNFESANLEDLLTSATIKPSVNQVECHPYYPQDELRARLAPYGTLIESWYPLGHGNAGLLDEPLFAEFGAKYGKTPAQVILRWHIQKQNIIFPKSTNPAHIAANMDIFDFALTDHEMERVAGLASGRRFYTLSLAEQEKNLGAWTPAD